jgi:hypothetical protein
MLYNVFIESRNGSVLLKQKRRYKMSNKTTNELKDFDNINSMTIIKSMVSDLEKRNFTTASNLVFLATEKGFRKDIAEAAVRFMAFDSVNEDNMVSLHENILMGEFTTVVALNRMVKVNEWLANESEVNQPIVDAQRQVSLDVLEW